MTIPRVRIEEGATQGPNWQQASRSLQFDWKKPGGDFLAGATATFSLVDGSKPVIFDVTAAAKLGVPLLVHTLKGTPPKFAFRTSATPPKLTVVTDTGTFVCPCITQCGLDPSSNTTVNVSNLSVTQTAVALDFDRSSVTGTIQSATLSLKIANWYGAATLAADGLDMPLLITDPSKQLGGVVAGIAQSVQKDADLATHPDMLFYSECKSETAIKAGWSFVSPNYPGGKVCINPQFVSWPEVGLIALRMESQSPTTVDFDNSSILTWREYPAKGKTYKELYTRYLLKIDPDVYVGMNELGVKLPGFEGSGFSYRMEHGTQSAAHPNVFRLVFYAYDAQRPFDDPNRGSIARKTSICMLAGQIYSIEQHVRLNTISTATDGTVTANKDGVIEVFVDGVLVYSDYAAQVSLTPTGITSMPFANFFHGGSGLPKAPIHYEFSGVGSSQKYIGPPQRAVATPDPTGTPGTTGSTDPLPGDTGMTAQITLTDDQVASVVSQDNTVATLQATNQQLTTANATLTASNTQLTSDKAALQSKLDAIKAARASEEAGEVAADAARAQIDQALA